MDEYQLVRLRRSVIQGRLAALLVTTGIGLAAGEMRGTPLLFALFLGWGSSILLDIWMRERALMRMIDEWPN